MITQTPTVAIAEESGLMGAMFEAWCTAVPWITLWSPNDGPLDVAIVDVLRADVSPVDYAPQFAPNDFRRATQEQVRELISDLFGRVTEEDYLNTKHLHLSGHKRDTTLRECWRAMSGYEVLVTDEIHGLL
ncbi:hypothetical protein H7R52_00690 [Weissella confusa]|uniref:Uncharacterized protein n=1 Tax=Weissella confusa TaxID=1583 RepID=A0A923SMI3_WEICO|nr:hypothetical protein [Weissella confusa]